MLRYISVFILFISFFCHGQDYYGFPVDKVDSIDRLKEKKEISNGFGISFGYISEINFMNNNFYHIKSQEEIEAGVGMYAELSYTMNLITIGLNGSAAQFTYHFKHVDKDDTAAAFDFLSTELFTCVDLLPNIKIFNLYFGGGYSFAQVKIPLNKGEEVTNVNQPFWKLGCSLGGNIIVDVNGEDKVVGMFVIGDYSQGIDVGNQKATYNKLSVGLRVKF